MKKNLFFLFLLLLAFSILTSHIKHISAATLQNKTYHNLATGPLLQDWSDVNLIVDNDDWSAVPGIEGYSGVFLTNDDITDPQTIIDPDSTGQLNVFANQYSPATFHNAGVTEFDYYLIESIAISGSGTANAPYIKIYLNSTTCSNIRVKYNAIDLDNSEDNTIQQIALHYRVNGTGNFINIPAAYISDATEGPNKSGKITPVDITLPSDANDQSLLELRIMTADAYERDEWVGIDDIEISATCVNPYAAPIIPNCPDEINSQEGNATSVNFSASDQDGIVSQASILSDPVPGIQFTNLQPAQNIGGDLTGQLLIGNNTPPGDHQVELHFTNNDPSPQTASCTIPIHVTPQPCTLTDTHQIGEIQGEGSSSPIDANTTITTTGVVTATFFEGGINGFYLQDPDGDGNELTSDALFIQHSSNTILAGQSLQLTGTVYEYYGRTQLVDIKHLEICDNSASPTPIILSLPAFNESHLERYENMLVTFPQSLTINGHQDFVRYGELILGTQPHISPTSIVSPGSPEYELLTNTFQLDQIILDDGKLTYNPEPLIHPNGNIIALENLFRTSDSLTNITGILDFAYGNYRVQPTEPALYTNANPRISHPEAVNGDIKVASFNVMNYFTTLGSRGATNETELTRQREKLYSAITQLDADILGLVEIENNAIAVQDLVTHLNAAIGEERYAYINTGIIGIDEIKVALLYQPASVTPIGNYALLDASVDPRFKDEKNRPSLAQTFADHTNQKNFTVIVNHLKSKSSSCEDIGDPDLEDGAGNCNLTRLGAAQALVDWLSSDPTHSNSHDYLIIGDLNAYRQEQPIQAILTGADDESSTFDDYTDLLYQFLGENAYTYIYNSQRGYLDHSLASNFLTQRVSGATIWHINADEPNFLDYHLTNAFYSSDQYRSSDHDPILIGLDFSKDIAPLAFSQKIESTMQNNLIQIRLEAIDEYNRPLIFAITENPENGTIDLSGDLVTYKPKPNYSGSDSFSFVANNGIEDSNQATIALTIQPFNNPPSAKSDTYEVEQNQTLTIEAPGVLGNDSDLENDLLSAVLINRPSNGTLTINSNGSFLYNPEKDFSGEVNFSYKAFDGKDYSVETIVTIKINFRISTLENKIYLPLIVCTQ